MSIALDAMGGDHAPREIVLGAVQAAARMKSTIVLVGDPDQINKHLPGPKPHNIEIHPASEAIGMEEKPMEALRKKKDSSISVAAKLVHEGYAKAFVSAGNTGACSAACLLSWRQIPGVHRPAIASLVPGRHGHFVLLDAGASPDVDPEHIVEFALMGRAYAETLMGRRNPKVHLLNIGEEPGKGNAFARQAFELLACQPWFEGNVEGKDMFLTPCDVVVCDAFIGNVVLKTAEGVAEFVLKAIASEVPENPIAKMAYWPVKRAMGPTRKLLDYSEYGGSPLLGLNGLCIICHGRSNAKAIMNALLLAHRAVENGLTDAIRSSFSKGRELETND